MEPCPNCGQPVRASARFCTSCGYRIPERAEGSTENAPVFASGWIEESTGQAPAVEAESNPSSTWPTGPAEEPAASDEVQWAPPAPAVMVASEDAIVAAPAAVDPIDEIVAATAGFNSADDTIVDMSHNKINMALYHIETLRQILPDLSNWSEDRAEAVNDAIAAMEAAIKGRESDEEPFVSLRHTVAAAKKDPRDIDVMIALSDRATDIEDLLIAHDKYSIGIRTALIDLKPLAVEYVKVPKARRTSTRKATASRSRSTASKSATTTTKSSTSSSTSRARKTSSTAKSE